MRPSHGLEACGGSGRAAARRPCRLAAPSRQGEWRRSVLVRRVSTSTGPASPVLMVLDVDWHVAASGVYQDVGGSGSGCGCVVGETGSDDNRRLGGDRRGRGFDPLAAGDAVWSTNTQSEPVSSHSSVTTEASKATPSSSRICTSAVGSSGTPGSTRSSWTRRGHRLATYEPSGRNRRRFRRHQRLTPVVALRIHSPEVRS